MDLLIDGRNNVYRAVFAGLATGKKKGHASIVLRCINKYLRKYKPSLVHIMWDYGGVIWRTRVYPQYKATRGANKAKHIEKFGIDPVDAVNETVDIVTRLFDAFGFKQYEYKYQEADDLIYSYCKLHTDRDIIVVSSDSDLIQIPFHMDHVSVLNPLKNKIMDVPELDPVLIKCLKGDVSDNIQGFKGIGPVKAKKMALDEEKLKSFLDEGDGSRWKYYKIYNKIICLNNNPFMKMNDKYVMEVSESPVNTYRQKLVNEAVRYSKIPTLLDDVRNTKRLVQKCIQV